MTEPELPAAFLFLHLEKTGGTSVRTWLALNQDTSRFQEPARLQLVSPDCFEALTLDTGRVRDACPGPVQPVAWDRSITAVEYHSGGAKAQFWRHVDHARSLYAKAGGRFLTAVLLQEPVAQAVSFYRYWPPTEQGPDGPNSLIPLERWVRSGTANSVLQSRGIATTRGGDCNQSARVAMRRLGEIGLVGVTPCLAAFIGSVERRLGLPHDPRRMEAVLHHHMPPRNHAPHASWSVLDWAVHNATHQIAPAVHAQVQAAVACDQPLYAAALESFCASWSGGRWLRPEWARCMACQLE